MAAAATAAASSDGPSSPTRADCSAHASAPAAAGKRRHGALPIHLRRTG